jgi:hypothetical protein
MPSIAGVALETPFGDLADTVAALGRGESRPARLVGNLQKRLIRLAESALTGVKPDLIILATTKGDITAWTNDLFAPESRGEGGPAAIARALGRYFSSPAFAVSAACASGSMAVGVAARLLADQPGKILIVAGDCQGAFIEAGFSSLNAIDPNGARPFDALRSGLCLGETAAAVLLSSDPADGGLFVQGWGASMDANHLTGPSRTGDGLLASCKAALKKAGVSAPALVIAHATGTRYNDDAESIAYATLLPEVPVAGYKGALGHSLGASGLTEFAIATRLHAVRKAPGTVGLRTLGCAGAIRALPPGLHDLAPGPILHANAGFGGLNAAVLIGAQPPAPTETYAVSCLRKIELSNLGWSVTSTSGVIGDGAWQEPAASGHLPRLSARDVIGRVDSLWGRMDMACRALVALGHFAGPLPEQTAVVLLSERGCAASDRLFEEQRRQGTVDPQRFPYTLPSAPIGEASIRLRLRGAGFAMLGATDEQGRDVAKALLRDGAPHVLLARVEADRPPHLAWAEVWSR